MDATNLCKNNEIIFDKSRAEELDEKIKKDPGKLLENSFIILDL